MTRLRRKYLEVAAASITVVGDARSEFVSAPYT